MTPEAQRIAIAEACGWQHISTVGNHGVPFGLHPDESKRAAHRMDDVPDYLHDLNAMHEAEKIARQCLMNADQWEGYGHALERIHPTACLHGADYEPDYYDFATLMCELSAAQRAEAFLRCIGAWDDTK